MTGMLAPQRYRVAEHAEFERVAADGGTRKFHLGTFDQPQDH
jgi:hypothetical protein